MLIVSCDGIGTRRLDASDPRSIVYPLIVRLREKTGARHIRVDWPASLAGIGGPLSWVEASRRGVLELDRVVSENPDEDLILLGYSGGNRVVHEWLDSRPHLLHRVAAVGLLSDPFRPRGRGQFGVPGVGGFGICGERLGPVPDRTFWCAALGDVITDCPEDSPLRTVADLSDRIPGGFLDDFGRHLSLGDWQLASYIQLWRRDPWGYLWGLGARLDRARRDVEGYLGSAHTRAYILPFETGDGDLRPLTVRLADSIAWAVRDKV